MGWCLECLTSDRYTCLQVSSDGSRNLVTGHFCRWTDSITWQLSDSCLVFSLSSNCAWELSESITCKRLLLWYCRGNRAICFSLLGLELLHETGNAGVFSVQASLLQSNNSLVIVWCCLHVLSCICCNNLVLKFKYLKISFIEDTDENLAIKVKCGFKFVSMCLYLDSSATEGYDLSSYFLRYNLITWEDPIVSVLPFIWLLFGA